METLQKAWHILSTPGTDLLKEKIEDGKIGIVQSLSDNIDEIALMITTISILLAVFGSKTAKKYTYWTIILYFFSKIFLNTLLA